MVEKIFSLIFILNLFLNFYNFLPGFDENKSINTFIKKIFKILTTYQSLKNIPD